MVYLYLVCGIIIGCLFTWLFLQRRSPEITMSSDEGGAFRDNVSKLITEFNKISNANINTLEDKIQDIREVIELADEKIVRINSSLSDMGIVARRMEEKSARGKEETHSLVEIVSLSKKKYQPTVDISLPAALPLSEMILEKEERKHKGVEAGSKPAPLLTEEGTEDEKEVFMAPVSQPESPAKTLMPRDITTKAQRHKDTVEPSPRPSSIRREREAQSVQLPEVLPSISKVSKKKQPEIAEKKKAKPRKEKEEEKPTITPLPKTATKEEKIEVINELLSAGFSVEDISRAVELSQTEVQLILGLKKKRL